MATILVEILGNAKQFKEELDGAVKSTDKANSGFSKMKVAAGVAGGILAGVVVEGLSKSVEAAQKAQEETGKLNQAFDNAGMSAKKMAPFVDNLEASQRKLGFTNNDTRGSLTKLVTAGENATQAHKDMGIASDLARFKNESLSDATSQLIKVHAGNTRALKELGIVIPPVTTATQKLKDEGVKNTTALGRHELALAAVRDKMATGAEAAQILAGKVKGQADEFSKSSEGGMAQFHAQVGNIEEKIGSGLIPTLTLLIGGLNKVIAWVTANWPQISAIFMQVFNKVKGDITALVNDGKALFERFHGDIMTVLNAVKQLFKDAFKVISDIFNIFGDLVRGDWSKLWSDLKQLARDFLTGIKDEIKLGLAIVKAEMDVVWAAISRVASAAWDGLKSAITGAISGIVGWVKGNWPIIATLISGPFAPLVALATNAFGIRSALVGAFNGIKSAITGIVTGVAGWIGNEAATIGKNLVSGIIDGLGGLYDALKNKLEGTIHSVVTGLSPFSTVRQGGAEHIGAPLAQGVIDGWLLGVAQLPSKISQSLQNAVQAGQRVIQSAQSSFQTAWQQLASDADTAFRGITSAIQTPAEKTLAALQSEHDQAQRSKALTDAQAQLADAQAGGDPAAIASAQQAVADAQYAIQVAALEKQAALQRTQLDARHALQQRHFDAALAQLETHLAKAHSSYAAAHTAILKLFKSFGINYQSAGGDLGSAFITGLKESIQKAAKGAGSLSGALTDVAAGIHVPHAATGGVVSQTGLAVIHAGETIIPAGSGATVNITVNGWVGSDQAIAEKLRNELIRLGRNTTGGALGGFA